MTRNTEFHWLGNILLTRLVTKTKSRNKQKKLRTELELDLDQLISWESIKHLIKEFLLCLLILEILLMGVFTVLDLIVFYMLFEGVYDRGDNHWKHMKWEV